MDAAVFKRREAVDGDLDVHLARRAVAAHGAAVHLQAAPCPLINLLYVRKHTVAGNKFAQMQLLISMVAIGSNVLGAGFDQFNSARPQRGIDSKPGRHSR